MLNNIKIYIIGVLIICIAGLFYIIEKEREKRKKAELELIIEINNKEAAEQGVIKWRDAYDQANSKSIGYLYTIDQMKSSHDSINQRLLEHIKEQDMRLRDISSLLHAVSETEVVLEKEISIPTMPDTTIDLSNPHVTNIINLSPEKVSSYIHIADTLTGVFTDRKITVKPRKKFFLCRWFQKKHTLVEVQITRSNPFVETTDQKFIHIVK